MNVSHLNLTRLAEYADDEIFLKLNRKPEQGWIERVDELIGIANGQNQRADRSLVKTESEEMEIVQAYTVVLVKNTSDIRSNFLLSGLAP